MFYFRLQRYNYFLDNPQILYKFRDYNPKTYTKFPD